MVLPLFFMGYTVKGMFFPQKECVMWKEDHCETIDCLDDNQVLGVIIPIDEMG